MNRLRFILSAAIAGFVGELWAVCNANLPPKTPDSAFSIGANGTATHARNGLMWMRCAMGKTWDGSTCTGTAPQYTWKQALAAVKDFNAAGGFAGHTDWRLPNIKELNSIVERQCSSPAINANVFPNTGATARFWSSTPSILGTAVAWKIEFYYGDIESSNMNTIFQVRLVRGGQSFDNPVLAGSSTTATTLTFASGWSLAGNSSSGALDVIASFGDQTKVTSVWKWIAAQSKWAFYTPMQNDGGAAYAASKGYDLLASVAGGEGFWVNAKTTFTAPKASGTAIATTYFQTNAATGQSKLAAGWSLIAIGDNKTPSQFNSAIGATPPAAGEVPANLTTLWAWDANLLNWYYYAPSLEAKGGTILSDYIIGKGYLNFGTKVLDPTIGFWVNKP